MKLNQIERPINAADLAKHVGSLEGFGRAVRDWQHELRKLSTRKQLAAQWSHAPKLLQNRFKDGDIADAYLAGYVCYLADKARLPRPRWAESGNRIAQKPWFSNEDRKRLLVTTPGPLREHNIFTEPEDVIHIHVGRPQKSLKEKRKANADRQRRYRLRVRGKLEELKRLKRKLKMT